MFKNNFDWSSVKEDSFMPLPVGKYTTIIEFAEIMTKGSDGTKEIVRDRSERSGDWVNIQLSIIDEKFLDRKIFDGFRLWEENEQHKNIAQARFKKLCEIIKVNPSKDNIHMLENKIVGVEVVHRGKKNNGEPWINIHSYFEPGGQTTHNKTDNKPVLEIDDINDDDIPF